MNDHRANIRLTCDVHS